MDGCAKYESNEKSNIPVTYTSANPRTVMIVDLNTNPTSAAMERSWRSQNLA
jgi:hypothetical protein